MPPRAAHCHMKIQSILSQWPVLSGRLDISTVDTVILLDEAGDPLSLNEIDTES